MRLLLRLVVVALLIAGAVAVEKAQSDVPREDPLGRQLLFLPSVEALDLVSLGNEQLTADVLYLWAIQYYSLYESADQFLYLEVMFDLITDLDPRFADAYRLGGMLLSMAAMSRGGDRDPTPVAELYHKGVEAMPEDYALAETAAWDFFTVWRDVDTAVRFLEIARHRPGAPARIARVLGRWRDNASLWSYDDSIAYWYEALDESDTDFDRRYAQAHLYDVVVDRDRSEIEPILATYRAIRGHCPGSWAELEAAGVVDGVPVDLLGRPYGLDPEWCSLVANKKIKD